MTKIFEDLKEYLQNIKQRVIASTILFYSYQVEEGDVKRDLPLVGGLLLRR